MNRKTGEKVYLRKPQATPPRDYYDELDDAKPAPAAAREPWHDEQQSGGRLSSLRAKALGKAARRTWKRRSKPERLPPNLEVLSPPSSARLLCSSR